MKTAIAAKPHIVELNPFLMFSAPSDGPMVRSSMMSIGAASEPARSSSDVSLASVGASYGPKSARDPPPISVRITGAVTTSPLPFSMSRMAMRLPTFSRVMSLKMRAP
jgi:hypothetical protein